MVRKENHCVDCGMHCRGSACPKRNVEVYYCDDCGDELPYNEIYDVDGEHFCLDCLKKKFLMEW
jgi:hypothetical protein